MTEGCRRNVELPALVFLLKITSKAILHSFTEQSLYSDFFLMEQLPKSSRLFTLL